MHGSLAPLRREELPNPPTQALATLDLSAELYAQYVKAKNLLTESSSEPLNQKAQTLNSIVSVLAVIAKIRTELYNAERLKKLESCLIEALLEFPALQEAFMERYERELLRV